MTPPALDRVVRTCLAKDPEERWQIGGRRRRRSSSGSPRARPPASRRRSRSSSRRAAGNGLPGRSQRSPSRRRRGSGCRALARARGAAAARADEHPAAGEGVPEQRRRSRPTARRVVFSGTDATGKVQLWVRPLDSYAATPLAGNRGRHPAVLVARRALHRLLRRQEAEAHRSLRRLGDRAVRRGRSGRRVGAQRRHPVRGAERSDSSHCRPPAARPSPSRRSTPRRARPRTAIRSSCRTASTFSISR